MSGFLPASCGEIWQRSEASLPARTDVRPQQRFQPGGIRRLGGIRVHEDDFTPLLYTLSPTHTLTNTHTNRPLFGVENSVRSSLWAWKNMNAPLWLGLTNVTLLFVCVAVFLLHGCSTLMTKGPLFFGGEVWRVWRFHGNLPGSVDQFPNRRFDAPNRLDYSPPNHRSDASYIDRSHP